MHEEYIRRVPGAKTAVLFIHGIVGTPNHFRDLMPLVSLVPDDWSIHNVRLPGHGGSVRDFGRSSMKAWKTYVQQAFDALAKEHERVFVAAHSMGTLFALQLAVSHSDQIPQLFLLAVPMRPGLRWFAVQNVFRVALDRVRPDRPLEVATRQACGVEVSKALWRYFGWIPRFLELFREIHKTEKRLVDLRVPSIAWQSGRDELVANHSGKILRRYPVIDLRELTGSSHFYYTDADKKRVLEAFRELCDEMEKQD